MDSLIKNCKYENKQKEKKESSKNKYSKSNSKNINREFSSDDSDDSKIDIDYKKYCLFYQEEKGDIYYLDPLIMEILLSEYGDYNSLPTDIEGNILDISMTQVTGELKSKYKYLNHLRIGSIIYFVEIDVDDLISANTKEKFREKLNERKRMRNLLKNQEKNYELFLTKKNSKISEEEKESDSFENNLGSLFFINDEEIDLKKEIDVKKEKNDIIENKKENKLALLFEEKEKEEKEEKKNKEKEKDNINKEKGGKNKKNNKKGGKKGKKNNIKEMVFNSESCSESDN